MAIKHQEKRKRTIMAARLAYIFKRKRHVALFRAMICLAVAFALLGGGCLIYKTVTVNALYNEKIGIAKSTEYRERINTYKEAIELMPERTEAYILILEAFEEAGQFDLEESSEFTALYNKHAEVQSGKGAFNLNLKAGRMYFNLYTEHGAEVPMSAKVQKSYSYFAANHEKGGSGADAVISEAYYQICTFYRDYILAGANIRELNEDALTSLYKAISDALAAAESLSAYDKLQLFSSICNVLYDQRGNLHYLRDAASVLPLMETIHASVQETEATNQATVAIKERFLVFYPSCYEAIKRAVEGGSAE